MSKRMHHLNIGNENYEVVDDSARSDLEIIGARQQSQTVDLDDFIDFTTGIDEIRTNGSQVSITGNVVNVYIVFIAETTDGGANIYLKDRFKPSQGHTALIVSATPNQSSTAHIAQINNTGDSCYISIGTNWLVAGDQYKLVGTYICQDLDDYYEANPDAVVLQDGSVVTSKLADGAVTLDKMVSGIGLTESVKQALLACFEKVAWIDDQGQDYVDALESALYPPTNLTSISAVYTQSGTVYTHDNINDLKVDLVVTANYNDGTSDEVNLYTLSGTLTEGTSEITVTYSGKTDTFDVTVTAGIPSSYTKYDYIAGNQSNNNAYAVPYAGQIRLKTYANLNVLSCEFAYRAITGHLVGGCIFGRRTEAGSSKSFAFYAGDNTLGYHIHGNDSNPSLDSIENVPHIVKYNHAANSPSSLQVDDGTAESIVWSNSNVINADPCLIANANNNTSNMNLSYGQQCGYIKFFDANGDLLNHYFPVVRTADNVIGMFDIVEQTFYTTSTASYATIGNSNQHYKVGNWS